MKALISPNEPVNDGYRIAEVCAQEFEVAEPLFWVECADNVVADQFYYDPTTQTINQIPLPPAPPAPEPIVPGGPSVLAE